MVSFSQLMALSICAVGCLARVTDIVFPQNQEGQNIQQGSQLSITIVQHSFIENWLDAGVYFGYYQTGKSPCDTCIGELLSFVDLSQDEQIGNKTVNITTPGGSVGQYTYVAAVPYSAAASGITGFRFWNATLQIAY